MTSIKRAYLRAFSAILAVSALVWVWAAVMLWRHTKSDREFNTWVVAPEVERARHQATAPAASREPTAPYTPLDTAALNESLERMRVRHHFWTIREGAMVVFIGSFFCWIVTAQIQLGLRRRARESVARPPAPNAGHLVGELVELGRSFVARSKPDGSGIEVEVDGKRAVVVFRNLTFVAAFAGNKRRPLVELPFSELLAVSTGYDKGTAYLNLRTTLGRVHWTDKVRPFDTLAALLDDIVELNRTSPDTYQAARAREPSIKTPWYGWVLLLSGLGGIATLAWYFLSHPI